MTKRIRKRVFMVVEQIDKLPFVLEKLPNILSQAKTKPLEWAFIEHNRDKDEDGNAVKPHLHLVLKFKNPQTVSSVAKMLGMKDEQQVAFWDNRINNAYSYILHRTLDADNKYVYAPEQVVSSFDFVKRFAAIDASQSLAKYKDGLEQFANGEISLDELRQKISLQDFALHKAEIEAVNKELAYRYHVEWAKEFAQKDEPMKVHWYWGPAGTGKTTMANKMTEGHKVARLGASNDYFQEYRGENIVIINDLRPNELRWSDLLTMLDPYEVDKQGPRRYKNIYLNLEEVYITTPYSPKDFYDRITSIQDRKIDSFRQLERRITDIVEFPINRKKGG